MELTLLRNQIKELREQSNINLRITKQKSKRYMEQIIVQDYETTCSRVNFLQVIQSGIIVTDDKLKIKSKYELRSRL